MAPKTIYLHVGLHKTGTTYLQNLLRANRKQLRGQEVFFPGGKGEPVQSLAVWDLQGRQPRGVTDRRVGGSWQGLVDLVNGSKLPTALISEERLSLATLKQAAKAVDAFPHSEVHVIITARDLARVSVSAWQEEIKNDQTWTWQEFAAAIKDPARVATNPARGFWMRQDLPAICSTWESVVPAERLHIVTVPRSGASPDELLARIAAVVGFAPKALTAEPRWNNETVGVAATEVIRRVNERLGGRLNQREHDKIMKMTLVQMLARRSETVRSCVPDAELAWIGERAEQSIKLITERGYQVTGDLDELRPVRREGSRRPDDATESELLDAALDALALLAEDYATTWWEAEKASVEEVKEAGDLRSRSRRLVFEGQRRAATLADKNPVAAKAMGAMLSRREKARERAREKARARKVNKSS